MNYGKGGKGEGGKGNEGGSRPGTPRSDGGKSKGKACPLCGAFNCNAQACKAPPVAPAVGKASEPKN